MALTQADIDEIDISMDINGTKNNVEIREAFQKILNGGSTSSLVYSTRITQLSILPPIAALPALNSTGVVPVWGRSSIGVYTLTFTGLTTLNSNNVIPLVTMGDTTGGTAQTIRVNITGPDELTFSCFDGSGVASELLGQAFIKIDIYE
jgi:hypothetical protein